MPQLSIYPDSGRILLAEKVFPALTHLAVGDGAAVDEVPSKAAVALKHELGRVRYLERKFLVADTAGTIIIGGGVYKESIPPTRLLYFRFRFEDTEAQGSWSEMGLFGGDVQYITRIATLIDQAVAGDDTANQQVTLSGTWDPAVNGSITVTVTTGGVSGTAKIGWIVSAPLVPYVVQQSNVPVTFGTPISIPGSGLTLTFSGGGDAVLTLNDAWRIDGTQPASRPEYAGGGLYHPASNPTGQVKTLGTLFRLVNVTPAQVKGAVVLDVQVVVEVVNA